MIQQTIDLAGWQQFITAAEVTAAVMALLIGWGLTEIIKRIVYLAGRRSAPRWLWPLLGFLVTLASVVHGWPANGVFPHRWLAALAVAATAPALYAGFIWFLRYKGWNGLASAFTGNRRATDKSCVRLERRKWP